MSAKAWVSGSCEFQANPFQGQGLAGRPGPTEPCIPWFFVGARLSAKARVSGSCGFQANPFQGQGLAARPGPAYQAFGHRPLIPAIPGGQLAKPSPSLL